MNRRTRTSWRRRSSAVLIGHLPAGYLAATAALRETPAPERNRLMAAALLGSVAPDLDLLYFYGVDSSVHHHAFLPHWPLLWVGVAVLGAILSARHRIWGCRVGAVALAALLHCALDSIAGSVRWLAPFSDHETTLVTIPPTHDSWIVSFVTHWTFGVEIALVGTALALWVWRRGTRPSRHA